MQPTKGRTVLYKLSAHDALTIGQKRASAGIAGNTAAEGDIFPATVVQDWGGGGSVNLKVHLDGHDDFWATSRTEGEHPGQWACPAIEAAAPESPQLGDLVHYTAHGTPFRGDGTQASPCAGPRT